MMKVKKRGTLWPARLSCGHLSLVSFVAICAGASRCRLCPAMLPIRSVDKLLGLRAREATRPWAGICP